jgi:acetylornithine deacetylase/succinyl-diaminopimelate desuccinylase-like protein
MRLVLGQDPATVKARVVAHLRTRCPDGVALEIEETRGGVPACSIPGSHPVLHAMEETMAEVLGVTPLSIRMGATLPVNALLREALGIQALMLSYATADQDFHAPNECLRLPAIGEGLRAWCRMLERVGGLEGLRPQTPRQEASVPAGECERAAAPG